MPFINKVTVKGTTYYLENLVANNGAHVVSLPDGITKNDTFVTESTISNFTASRNEMDTISSKVSTLESNLGKKVDKVSGRGLSTNDFTTEYKTTLDNLAGNLDKKVDKDGDKVLSTNDFTNEYKDTLDNLSNNIDNKVDKVEGKTLSTNDFTNTYKEALDSLANNYDAKGAADTALTAAKKYTDDQLAAFESFDTEIVDELPATTDAKENTFYLVPKTSGNGYEKYWLIDGEWDEFTGSSTEIVSSLSEVSEPSVDVDYIVYDGSVCLYYKWIGNGWRMVAGSVAKVVESLDGETANEFTDYYVKNGDNAYFHYRWDKGTEVFRMVGSDSYSKSEVDAKVRTLENTIAQQVEDIATNATNISDISGKLDSLIQQFNALDTEGYTYYMTYGHATMVETGEESDYVLTLYQVKDEVETIKSQCIIQGGGGATSTTTMTFERVTPTPAVFLKSDKAEVVFNFTAVDTDGEDVDCTYVLKREGQVVEQGNLKKGENRIDLTNYALIGTQKFTLNMIDPAGQVVPKSWTVQIVDIRIESDFKDNRTYVAGNTVNFTYKPYGAVPKTVHFVLDGKEIGTTVTSASGAQQSYPVPAHGHGAHLFECYITADINGQTVGLEEIIDEESGDVVGYKHTIQVVKDIVWFDESAETPVIGCIYRSDYYGKVDAKQYNTTNIPYYVFDPKTSTPAVTHSENGEVVSTQTLEGSVGNWAYKTDVIGEHNLEIACRGVVVPIVMNISDLGINVKPVTSNLAFDFNPVGYSNNDADRRWIDDNTGVTMSVSDNFDWSNGGYQLDADGNQYFCVKAGTSATINYNLFANDLVDEDGTEFKFVFKTTNVGDPNAKFLTCKSGTDIPVGIEMSVHSANMYAGSAEEFLNIPYSEEDKIEFEFNINPLGDADDAESFIMAYEDGVGYRPFVYDASNRLYQQDPKAIVIGSTDCDVHIYRMKAYTSYLSDVEILSNFIADAPNAEEMIARYNRNQIYDEYDNLDPDKLAKACPNLKIIKLTCPRFTVDKDDKVAGCTIQCVHAGGDPVLDNWTATNCSHSGQGTTSNKYGIAGRNIRLIMNNDNTEITMGDGTTKYINGEGKVTLTRGSVPNNFYNFKANIASSENANNALLAKRYNDFLPYQSVANKRDSKVKNTMEFVNAVVFVKEVGELSDHTEFQDDSWHFYAIGNLGDDKKTDKSRANDSKDIKEFVIEITDNTMPCSTFPNGEADYPIIDGEWEYTPLAKSHWTVGNTSYDNMWVYGYDEEGKFKTFGDGTYEFRYEAKGITDEQRRANIQTWCDFYGWVVTATDEEFVNELGNWFIEDAALYYYVFTERYTMTDSRSKNSFWHWSKVYLTEEEAESDYYKNSAQYYEINNEKANINHGYRFDFWDYDNDTSIGIDNNGVLNRPYGKEDIDVDEKGSYIFNGAESTFFMRIRNLMHGGLTRVYNAVSDAWSATSLINEFDSWQAQFPEELWRLDLQRKYYRPFTGESIDNSIPKLDKGFLKERFNGRKKYHRRQFERDQEIYMGTKYLASSVTTDTNDIMFRVNSPVGAVVPYKYELKIVPYIDMYVSAMFGNAEPQQVRAKAGEEVILSADFKKADDTMINIYAANRIMALDGIAPCYIKTNRFGNATKLKKLIIGNHTPGYSNPYMETLNLGNNYLLKELDLTGCDGLKGGLNMTKLGNLETLIADGTSLESVTFATNGKISSASLPATITTAIMKNLAYLTDGTLTMPTDKLDTFTEENCQYIDEKAIVSGALDTLTEVRLVGIDWVIESSDLLNKIHSMYKNFLSGKVHITGHVRQRELDAWAKAWPDLVVTYEGIIDQYPVTFLNADGTAILDKNGEAYVQWVDQGAKPYEPIAVGDIDTPTLASTAQYDFTFASWDGIDVNVTAPVTVTAVYSHTIRTYTVRWLKKDGVVIQTKTDVPYGSGVEYEGEWPTMTDNESSYIYNIFTGWNKSTGFITGNTDVYARWQTANGLPSSGTEMWDMTPVQLYGVTTSGKASEYFKDKDYVDIQMGNDYSYENVEDSVLGNEVVLNGSAANVVDSDIKLFGAECGSFTMAIDYEFVSHRTDATLVSCYEFNNKAGFRLKSNGTHPVIEFGDVTETVGCSKNRDMLVIRYAKDTNTMHVYTFNGTSSSDSYAESISYTTIVPTKQASTEATVMLGAFKFLHNGVLDNLGNGIIHWAKVWKEDLGDAAARSLAAWTHESLRFEYIRRELADDNYRLASDSSRRAGASFICQNLLGKKYKMMSGTTTTNKGGWDASAMKIFVNSRFYDAFPTVWKSIIRQVQIPANTGSDSIATSRDYIYLPSYVELSGESTSPYSNEGSQIGWMINSSARTKTINGVANAYYTRSANYSPSSTSTNGKYFVIVNSEGAINSTFVTSYSSLGICPCFSI